MVRTFTSFPFKMKLFTIGNVVNDVTICIGFNIPALKDEAIHMRNLSDYYRS